MALRCLALLLLLLTEAGRVWGCSIPVFRYALERWRPATYEAVLFHRGQLPQPCRDLVARLGEHRPEANVSVTTVDLDGKVEPDRLKLWDKQGGETPLPWLVVRFPEPDEKTSLLWAGTPTEEVLGALLDSPRRQELVKHLTSGEAAVFILLAGEDEAANKTATALLERELKRQQQKIKLPEPTSDGPQLLSGLPLRVAFPVLSLSLQEPAERMLLGMLLRGDEDLTAVKGPIVFPVFGRGRMLCALHGPDLNAERIAEAARFLCGACSCRVKELNPGVDLLIAAAWTDVLGTKDSLPKEPLPPPPLPEATASPVPTASAAGTAIPEPVRATTAASDERRWLWWAVVGAGGLALLSGAWALRSHKDTNP